MYNRHPGIILLCSLGLLVVAIPCAAQIELRFDPPDTFVTLGDNVHLSIILDEPQDVRSFEVRLRYDPDILTFVDGQPGQGFQDSGCQLFEGVEEDTLGLLYGYVVILGANCWMTGPGEVYGWEFSGSAAGISEIVVDNVALFAPQIGELENVSLGGTTVAVIGLNHPPVVTDIPDQTVQVGGLFTPIILDEYVSDVESPDNEIIWVASGNTDLNVDILDRVVTITAPADWHGSEVITFTATDENGTGLSDSDDATFTVHYPSDVPALAPTAFSLQQCRPNPFNPSTFIDFEIMEACHVNVGVYSLAGRRVAVLVDKFLSPGRFTTSWNGRYEGGRLVASGTYLYRLEAGAFSATKRMTMLK